jgi:hypothetical protein
MAAFLFKDKSRCMGSQKGVFCRIEMFCLKVLMCAWLWCSITWRSCERRNPHEIGSHGCTIKCKLALVSVL